MILAVTCALSSAVRGILRPVYRTVQARCHLLWAGSKCVTDACAWALLFIDVDIIEVGSDLEVVFADCALH